MSAFLPPLKKLRSRREVTEAFRGYNHTTRPGDGEWYEMENLCGDLYPALSPRKPRKKITTLWKPNGLFAHEKLCWVDGTTLYYDGRPMGEVTDSEKQFVAMGAYVLIWPDKVFYHTETGELLPLEASSETEEAVSFTLCRADGSAFEDYATGDYPPEEPTDGQLWVDTSQSPSVLKQYSDLRMAWISMPTTYVRIGCPGIGKGFKAGDGVTLSGCETESLNGDIILMGAEEDAVIVTGIIRDAHTQESPVTLARTVPEMDFLTECNNRIWGCSTKNHELYACKLGDPTNWRCYQGLSTDSYAVTIGSPGPFTGACTHLGYVLFFKEQMIHKVYGYKPSNFEVTDTRARGVEMGSEKSLVVVNETLFYKSSAGICAYNASLPTEVSLALGPVRYRNAVAGSIGDKYYVSMEDEAKQPHLFVFDTAKGLWHREDDARAIAFFRAEGTLYCLKADGTLLALSGMGEVFTGAAPETIHWMAQTGDIGLSLPDKKYISRVQFRLEVDRDALVRVLVRYDHLGDWQEVQRVNPRVKQSVTVPIIPRRCDTMAIRLEGYGDFRLHSMAKTIEGGSDL